jgi:hypothetical protein
MNASIISALAGLIGAAIGGLTSGLAAWFAQKTQAHLQWLVYERGRRQDLYKEFIEAASRCYADALLHEKPEMPALVELYANVLAQRHRERRANWAKDQRDFSGAEQDVP